eukprot:747415-Hanusia_phi.AAC.12
MQLSLNPNASITSNVDGKLFPQIELLVYSRFQWCCFDTLVYVTLVKDGQTDLGVFLYGNQDSNKDSSKTLSCNQACVFSFLSVQHTGGNGFQLLFSTPGASVVSNVFSVYPEGLAILTAIPSQLVVQSNQTVFLPDPLVLSMQGLYAQQNLSNNGSFDGLHVVVKLLTGKNGTDSSSNQSLDEISNPSDLLPISARVNGTLIQNGFATFDGSLSLKIQHQAGKYFQLLFQLREYPNISVISNFFSLVPSKLGILIGSNFAQISSDAFLSVVKLDGGSNDNFNVDGLPSSLHVTLLDANDEVIEHSSCSKCVIARLMKCDNSTPFSTVNNFSQGLPQCRISLSDSESDQILGATQAKCATWNAEKTACISASENSDQFEYTLSNVLGQKNGTTSDVSKGIASFFDLQVHFVVGSGYILRFVFSPTYETANSFNVKSSFASEYGNVLLPDPRFSPNSNFMIRPYKMVMLQQPGGDGVDLGTEGGDGIAGTPDGVGDNHVFRVQPALAISGNGYLFAASWNTHGYTPLTAVIKDSSCGGSCNSYGLVLSGNVTPVSTFHLQYRAMPFTQNNRSVFFVGISPALSTISFSFNHVWSVTVNNSVYSYNISVSAVSFIFLDLKLSSSESMSGVHNIQLTFLSGIDTDIVSAADVGNGGLYTIVDSSFFDLFTNPDPPTNVKFINYGSKSFRLEFDPPTVLRQKPLTGFIIEVILCNQSHAGLSNFPEFNGSCPKAKDVYSDSFPLATELGTDYFDGGGFSIEMFLSYDNVSAGSSTGITIDFIPTRSIYPGDQIKIDLGRFGLLNFNASLQFDVFGEKSGSVLGAFDYMTSSLTLTVPDTLTLVESIPVSLIVPVLAGFVIPHTNFSNIFPPTKVLGQVVGLSSSGRFDNCKGQGCVPIVSTFLPIVQDSSSMDLSWSGALQYGGVGTACASSINLSSSKQFPTGEICSIFETSTQSFQGRIIGNSGQNGAPVGRYGNSPSNTNTQFEASGDVCLSTQGSAKFCALGVGVRPKQSIEMHFEKSSNMSNISVLELKLIPSVSLGTMDQVNIPLKGLLHEVSTSAPNEDFAVEVDGIFVGSWTSSYDMASEELIININSNIFAHQTVVLVTHTSKFNSTTQFTNFSLVLSCYLYSSSNRTTLLFKDGSIASSFTERYGVPVAEYSQSEQLRIESGKIFKVRVIAFNGRFRSNPVEVDSSTRAIEVPTSPTLFSQVSQDSLNVSVKFWPEISQQPTQILLNFSPSFDLPPASWISVKLSQFQSASIVSFCNQNDCLNKLYSDMNKTLLSDAITSAIFNPFTEELILYTNPNLELLFGISIGVFIPIESGILYPAVNQLKFDASHSSYLASASLSSFSILWVSQFPFASVPRRGFLLQMSSDQYWRYDIQSIKIPDDLSQHPGGGTTILWLVADLSSTSTLLQTSLNFPALLNRYIRIESELMKIKNVTVDGWIIERGVLETIASNHSSVLGGGTCRCFANGSHTGLPGANYDSCTCQAITLIQIYATDFQEKSSGIDIYKGWGAGCDLQAFAQHSWCNPAGKSFTEDIRTYQSAKILSGSSNLITFVSPCAGQAYFDYCNLGLSGCRCQAPHVQNLDDLQLLPSYQNIKINPSGNPLDYPSILIANLIYPVASTVRDFVYINQSISNSLSYIKINQEIMLVKAVTGSIFSIQIVSSGSGCLEPNGTLSVLNQQTNDFYGLYFTTAGQISSIQIINPGHSYKNRPDLGTSDPSCSNYVLAVVVINNALECDRGQLGTLGSQHLSGSDVSSVFSVFQQSMQYFFRIAAYNSAGISNYLYFDFQVVSVYPTVLSTTGGLIYVEMLGGGFSAAGLTLWIGSLANSTSVDPSKSKPCLNPELLDSAGTKLLCNYVPWVGKQHSIIATYENGMISKISVGRNFVSFQAPIISQIIPSYVEPFLNLTLTVVGNNFGPSSSDVSGVLILSDGRLLPCSPITLVSSSLLYCKLLSPTTVSQTSYVQLTVGTSWSGGGQVTSKSPAASLAIIGPPSQLTLTLGLDFNSTVSKYGLAVLIKELEVEFANLVGISVTRVKVVSIKAGSIIATFEISWGSPSSANASPSDVIREFVRNLQNNQAQLQVFLLLKSVNASSILTSNSSLLNQISNTAVSSAIATSLQICAINNVITDYQECFLCCTSTCPASPLPSPLQRLNRELKTMWCEQRCFDFCGGFVT